jgi:hypothetical protein
MVDQAAALVKELMPVARVLLRKETLAALAVQAWVQEVGALAQ